MCIYMDGNKINIINLKLSVCLLSEDVDTRGRCSPSAAGKLAAALCSLMAVAKKRHVSSSVLCNYPSFNFNAGRLNLNVHSFIKVSRK